MNADLAQMAVAMQMAATQHSAQIAMLKKSHEMQMSLVTMLADAAKALPPPPAGMGLRVDKSA